MSAESYIVHAARAAASPFRIAWRGAFSVERRGDAAPVYQSASAADALAAYVELRNRWLARAR